ncbi:PrpF domain-containing protein [Streptomyces sp. NPDC091279]|uniref:PrpF domain-containing protein n=1 Tax=unclassified Streptomyces TaxID=2593676 RepID=UPI0038221CE3
MTTLTHESVRAVGVDIGLWTVGGAAAPTLVVASSRRLVDPLPVLETAVATIGRPVSKVALAHPAADGPSADAEYVFAQVVERADGKALDLTPECGHSMLATATHLWARGRVRPAGGPLRLLTHRSGSPRVVECRIESLDARAGAYTAGLAFPLNAHTTDGGARSADEDFPLGRTPLWLRVTGSRLPLPVIVVQSGNPYAFVDASALGITGRDALMAAGEDIRQALREVRAQLAPRLGLGQSEVLPKPALVVRTEQGDTYARALSTDHWHPGLALTGLVALATLTADTTTEDTDLVIGHPGGTSEIGLRTRPDGCRVVVVADRRVTRLAQLPLEI